MTAGNGHSRRDVMVISAISFVCVGALAAAWPLFSSLGPNGASPFPFVELDVSHVAPRAFKPVSVSGKPLLVRRWSAQSPWVVTSAACSRCGCALKVYEIPAEPTAPTLLCPCCASSYDFAGKRIGQSTLPDLEAVPYKMLSREILRIG